MPGPFSMSSSTRTMEKCEERSSSALREKSAESVVDNGRDARGEGEGEGLDSQLWHACAGAMVRLPGEGSKVIYFPQGHAEHAASPPEFPRALALRSTIPCRVVSVKFLADIDTDEVHARIRLQPDPAAAFPDASDDAPLSPPAVERTTAFAKTLTQSDANNGGGFSVPRYCAETIFPRLDYTEDPPVQIVLAKDVHGTVWKFRHIYRGTPRRHLLTTGWSNFVNQKKLVAGDAIVFLRGSSGELCVGVRRSTTRSTATGDSSVWPLSAHPPTSRWELKPPEASHYFQGNVESNLMRGGGGADAGGNMNNFTRNRSRVTANSVLEAASLAASGHPFEVVYYPRATISEFCVKSNVVRASLQQNWASGMRFKMAVETEDASRTSWFVGTIAKVQEADAIRWPGSPWKMLQVTWDEPDLLQGIVRVSPWQVELVSSLQLPPFSLPKKKVRLSHPPELQLDGTGIMGFSMAAISSNMLGHITPNWHGFADSVPTGIQGARQDRSYGLTKWNFRSTPQQPSLFLDSFYQHQEPVMAGVSVSTELNMGSSTHQGLSKVQDHLPLIVSDPSVNKPAFSCNVPNKHGNSMSKSTPFLLFGKAIDTSHSTISQPLELSSTSRCQGQETLSDGNQLEAMDKLHTFLSGGDGNQPKTWHGYVESSLFEVGTLSWFKEQASLLDREQAIGVDEFNHCKVFKASDEVGRTLDLSSVSSYDELYGKLSMMFGVQKSEILSRVFCVDSSGSSRPVGNEPYRDFIKRVKRLKIVSESSCKSLSR